MVEKAEARRRFLMRAIYVVALVLRLFPHPANFSPLGAMSLFAGANARRDRFLAAIPFVALFLSDLVIGFHPMMPFVYGAYALTMLIGMRFARGGSSVRVAAAAVSSSALFFVVTNVGAWLFSATGYPRTVEGLVTALVAGIPFWRATLAADLGFTGLLFGLDAVAARKSTALASKSVSESA